jgi:hypothetical protein
MEKKMKVIGATLVLIASATLSAATAIERAHPVRPLAGYKCMMLNLTEQQFLDPSVRVPVRSEPAASAPEVGWAATNVAVREPPHIVNGFTEALFPNGATVWIESRMLRPYHSQGDPTAKCVPSVMSDETPGFAYPH